MKTEKDKTEIVKVSHKISRKINIDPIPAQELDQAIIRFTHTIGKYVEVTVATGSYAEDGEFSVVSNLQETIFFTGPDYEMLLSANPSWAPEKPEGVFKETDIFKFIDYLEAVE